MITSKYDFAVMVRDSVIKVKNLSDVEFYIVVLWGIAKWIAETNLAIASFNIRFSTIEKLFPVGLMNR